MHTLEPHFNWRNWYAAEDDERSPFFGREYSELYFTERIYNYVIHPQWDSFGSSTLYIKLLFADYISGHAIIEMIGEWNDLIGNDIMFLKRDIVEVLMAHGIDKFILIGENVLNFHYSDDEYYAEWFEEIERGYIVGLNFRDHVRHEMQRAGIQYYLTTSEPFNDIDWRPATPMQLCEIIDKVVAMRLTHG